MWKISTMLHTIHPQQLMPTFPRAGSAHSRGPHVDKPVENPRMSLFPFQTRAHCTFTALLWDKVNTNHLTGAPFKSSKNSSHVWKRAIRSCRCGAAAGKRWWIRLKCSSGSPDRSVVQMPDGHEVELFDDTTPHFHSELLPVREEIVSQRQPCYDSLGTMLSDSRTTNNQDGRLHSLPLSICSPLFTGAEQEQRKSSHNSVDQSYSAF